MLAIFILKRTRFLYILVTWLCVLPLIYSATFTHWDRIILNLGLIQTHGCWVSKLSSNHAVASIAMDLIKAMTKKSSIQLRNFWHILICQSKWKCIHEKIIAESTLWIGYKLFICCYKSLQTRIFHLLLQWKWLHCSNFILGAVTYHMKYLYVSILYRLSNS